MDYITKDSGEREEFDTGARRDTRRGKGRFDLIPALALQRWAVRMEQGAEKYGDRNWELGMPISRFLDSAIRHLMNYLMGDREEDHLAAALFNVGAIIHTEEMIERGVLPAHLNDLPDYSPPLRSPHADEGFGPDGTVDASVPFVEHITENVSLPEEAAKELLRVLLKDASRNEHCHTCDKPIELCDHEEGEQARDEIRQLRRAQIEEELQYEEETFGRRDPDACARCGSGRRSRVPYTFPNGDTVMLCHPCSKLPTEMLDAWYAEEYPHML